MLVMPHYSAHHFIVEHIYRVLKVSLRFQWVFHFMGLVGGCHYHYHDEA